MHSLKTAVGLTGGLLLFGCATSHVAPIETSLHAEFVGSTPCDAVARDFLKIPNNAACECIRWQLRLHSSDVARGGTYTLVTTHGTWETNGHGFFQGGTKTETAGQWVTTIGQRANPHTTVYQLQATAPHRSL